MSVRHNWLVCKLHTAPTVDKKALPRHYQSAPLGLSQSDAPWIVDPGQDGAQAGRSDIYLGELVELNQSDTYISELDELSELSDTSLELNELSDTEEEADLVAGRNGPWGLVEEKLCWLKRNSALGQNKETKGRDKTFSMMMRRGPEMVIVPSPKPREATVICLIGSSRLMLVWRRCCIRQFLLFSNSKRRETPTLLLHQNSNKGPDEEQNHGHQANQERSSSIQKPDQTQELRTNLFEEGGNDAPWIIDPGQDGAQLDPTKVSPSDEATMVEPEANFGRAGRSDTYLGELVELNQSDTYISELDELSELSDTSLELNELSDTKEGAVPEVMFAFSVHIQHLAKVILQFRAYQVVSEPLWLRNPGGVVEEKPCWLKRNPALGLADFDCLSSFEPVKRTLSDHIKIKQRNQRKRQNKFDDDEKRARNGDRPFTKAKRSNCDMLDRNESKDVKLTSKAHSTRCFKCHRIGHYANKFQNQKPLVTLESGNVETKPDKEGFSDLLTTFDDHAHEPMAEALCQYGKGQMKNKTMVIKQTKKDLLPFKNRTKLKMNPGQDGAQLDPTKVFPSDEATMVEPEANFGQAGRSDTYLGELVELNQSDTYISELDELNELSDTSLELNQLSDTEEGAGGVVEEKPCWLKRNPTLGQMFGLLRKENQASKPQQDVFYLFKTVSEKEQLIFGDRKQFASNRFDFVQKQRNQRKRQNKFDDDEKRARNGDRPFTKAKRSNCDMLDRNESKDVKLTSKAHSTRCFKCHRIGHYANKFQNQKPLVTLESGNVETKPDKEGFSDLLTTFDDHAHEPMADSSELIFPLEKDSKKVLNKKEFSGPLNAFDIGAYDLGLRSFVSIQKGPDEEQNHGHHANQEKSSSIQKPDQTQDPGQDGAQLDPTKVFPSDEATMVEPEANFGRAGRSDTYLGELVELNQSDTYISELNELSDTSLELNQLSDTEEGAGLVAVLNGPFSAQGKIHKNSIWIGFTPNLTRPLVMVFCPFASEISTKGVKVVVISRGIQQHTYF
uniref:Uncharacterized protein n=1 Tax=Brassica oleracea var. oleracea TaxID=109376 RepID=A0A0D3DJM3_BRAOL